MNYYETLGVSKQVTQKEIKDRYRYLSKLHHPDAGGNEETFKAIAEAYEVLSDEKKRKEYDTTGSYKIKVSFESRFIMYIDQVFVELVLVQQDANFDAKTLFMQVVDEQLKSGAKHKKGINTKLTMLIDTQGRVKDKESVFTQVIKNRIQVFVAQVQQVESELDFLEKVKEKLQEFEYSFEETVIEPSEKLYWNISQDEFYKQA